MLIVFENMHLKLSKHIISWPNGRCRRPGVLDQIISTCTKVLSNVARPALPGQHCRANFAKAGTAGLTFPGHYMPSQHCWAGQALLGQHCQTCIARASIARPALLSITRQKHGHVSIAGRAWPGQHGQASMAKASIASQHCQARIARPGLPGQQCRFHWGGKRFYC